MGILNLSYLIKMIILFHPVAKTQNRLPAFAKTMHRIQKDSRKAGRKFSFESTSGDNYLQEQNNLLYICSSN
jgi:hypothetical protein